MRILLAALFLVAIHVPVVFDAQTSESSKVVFLSGINPETGLLEVPIINLWKLKGCQRSGIVDRVKSGIPVIVIEIRRECDPLMYKVKTYGANTGSQGWVSEFFIRH